jgi:galactose mutarotase-like enzyme
MSAGRYSVETTDLSGLPGRILRDEVGGVEVTILDRGAEPVSMRRLDRESGRWSGHLARDGEVGLASPWQPLHCTHLGLYAHTLIDNQSPYGQDWVRGRGHGFLPGHSHSRIETRVDEDGAFATYRIEPGDYPRESYPRALAFTIEQGLRDGWLEIAYRVENLEPDRPVHVSFGAHPAFPIAEPEKFEIRLSPGVYRQWVIDKGVHLTGETREFQVADGFTFPWVIASLSSPVLLEIVDVPNASVIGLDPVSGLGVELDLTERPTINFWSNSPSFVCMEPIWGLPDAAVQRPFDRKHGILEVPVGGVLTRRFRMRPFKA